jgi:hypothetical protein
MTRPTRFQFIAILSLGLVACGSTPPPGGRAGAGDPPNGGDGGSTAGAGGAGGAGGARMTNVGATSGLDAAVGDAASSSATDGAGDAAPTVGQDANLPDARSDTADGTETPAGRFTCNLLVGPSPMMQWFDGGFLQYPGIDPGKWELIWVAHHYTDAWAKPGDSAWNTPFERGHACASNAMMPDRVIFQATQWSHTTAAQWEADLTGIVNNIKTKWPGVKRIELMASTSAPGDMPCPAAGGKNNETIIPAFGYEAIEAMPAKFPGLVFALPHFEVPCNDFIGNGTSPQYAPNASATTGAAVMDVANIFGAYFSMHP